MPTTPATDAAARAAMTVYIERCAAEQAQEVVHHDPEVIARCIADDCRGFSSGGKLATKARMLAPTEPEARAAGLYMPGRASSHRCRRSSRVRNGRNPKPVRATTI